MLKAFTLWHHEVHYRCPTSKEIILFIKRPWHDSIHTLDLPEKNRTSDDGITDIAIRQSRVVITKDIDFLDSFLIAARPKKLIMVKTGNISNKDLIDIFSINMDMIIEMISRSNLVEINKFAIAEQN